MANLLQGIGQAKPVSEFINTLGNYQVQQSTLETQRLHQQKLQQEALQAEKDNKEYHVDAAAAAFPEEHRDTIKKMWTMSGMVNPDGIVLGKDIRKTPELYKQYPDMALATNLVEIEKYEKEISKPSTTPDRKIEITDILTDLHKKNTFLRGKEKEEKPIPDKSWVPDGAGGYMQLAGEDNNTNVEKVVGPDGKPVIVPRSQSIGMTPYVKDSQSAMQEEVAAIVELESKPNRTPEENKRLQTARTFIQLSQQTGMSQPIPIYDDKGKFTGLAGIVNKGGQMTTTYMPVAAPSGSTAGPKPTSPSDAFTTTVNQLSQITSDLKRANDVYDPKYVGFVSGPAGQLMDKTGLGASEKRQIFNSSLQGMKSIMVYLRTGKQINEVEIKNLEKELPTGGESETAYRGKMKRAVTQLGVIMNKYYDQQKGAGHTNFEDLGRIKGEVDQMVKQYGLSSPNAVTLPKGIPVGSVLYGKSKGGKDVYQTPAGKFFEVD